MRYGTAFILAAAAVIFLFARGMLEEKRRRALFARQLREGFGKLPPGYAKEASRYGKVASGHGKNVRGYEKETPGKKPDGYLRTITGRFLIDEITWEELDMEAVFQRLDYTLSQAGSEYLYAALHCPAKSLKEAEKWDALAAYFGIYHEERVRIQLLLAEIGKGSGSSFYDQAEAMKRSAGPAARREYAADAAYLLAALAAVWNVPSGFALLAGVAVYQIVTYFRSRAGILPYLESVAGLLRTVRGADRLQRHMDGAIRVGAETESDVDIGRRIKRLRTLSRHSFWVMQCGMAGSGPFSLAGDYIRMLFHPDMIQFIRLKNKIAALEPEIRGVYEYIGYVDSCISIAQYRASLPYYCIPELYDGGRERRELIFHMEEGAHPLLERPVGNSVSVRRDKGVLLTGSNASGKSTFLQMAAVNLLLAQTIHTAFAEEFSAPLSRLYTAMRDGGDIRKGESSYISEILSLKRVLDAGGQEGAPVFCFVDEILRGTGTVERIAASSQILRAIRPPRMYCFAATHDRELTRLLALEYDNYHFTEEIMDGDMLFSYKLLPGSADTGNAIRLLVAVGYDADITEKAFRQAENFLREGVWE